MNKVQRYVPTIGVPNWNVKEMNKKQRDELKSRLVLGTVNTHEEYQKVISYMYKKFPFEMDGVPIRDKEQLLPGQELGKSETAIQWRYRAGKKRVYVGNGVRNCIQSMYAFVVYDKGRDMEPVAFAGSYFSVGDPVTDDEMNKKFLCDAMKEHFGEGDKSETVVYLNPHGKSQAVGEGIVMFVDPSYRRLGLGTDLWWAEAKLYVEALDIRYQKEIQNTFSLESTRKMFDDPDKCVVTYEGRLKNDGTRAGIRCLLDYTDSSLKSGFESMLPGLKTIYEPADWHWAERENFTDEEFHKIWDTGKLV